MKTFLFSVRCDKCGVTFGHATVTVKSVGDANKAIRKKAIALAGPAHKGHKLNVGMEFHAPNLAAGELPQ